MRRTSLCLVMVAMIGATSLRASADETSHRAAAEEVLKLANTEKVMQASIDTTLAAQMKANPALLPVKDVMKKFFAKHLSYAAIKDDLITVYTEEFTEDELKQLAAFYRTPVGRKSIEKMPVLMQKGAEIGMKRVQDNSAELRKMIEDELKKSGGQK